MPGLDAARALAVAAMVFGHTAHGLLSDAARQLPGVQLYWSFRGLTAPLFLFVSGWAVMASVARGGLSGWPLVRGRLGRVALLIGLGLFLRWPGWYLEGLFRLEPDVVRHFVGFDALHCIALSLLIGVAVVSTTRSFRLRTALLAALAVAVPLGSTALTSGLVALELPVVLRSALVADAFSPFPVLPWIAYFFAGGAVGHLLPLLSTPARRSLALFAVGAVMTAGAYAIGFDLTQTNPVLFAARLGQVLIIAAGALALPVAVVARLAPLGRATLVVYVFHLPIIYGWSTFAGLNARLGQTLSLGQVALLALTLLSCGVLLAEAIRYLKPRLRKRLQRVAEPEPAPAA